MKMFCCANKKKPDVVQPRQATAPPPPTRTVSEALNSSFRSGLNRVGNDPDALADLIEEVPEVKESNIELVTSVTKGDIEFVEFYPAEREERFKFRYYCPICLRYFNHMLIS